MLKEFIKVNLFGIPRFLTNIEFYKISQSFPIGDFLTCQSSWACRNSWLWSPFSLTQCTLKKSSSTCARMWKSLEMQIYKCKQQEFWVVQTFNKKSLVCHKVIFQVTIGTVKIFKSSNIWFIKIDNNQSLAKQKWLHSKIWHFYMHLSIKVHNKNFLISENSVFFTWKVDIIEITLTSMILFTSNHIMALCELAYDLGVCNKET